jgi:hypothetical protein
MKKFTGGKSHYLFIILAFLMGGALSIGFLNLKSHLPIYAKTITIGQPVTLSGTNTISAGKFLDTANSAYFLDPASSTNALIVNGKIGIGTTAPSQSLEVAGNIKITGTGSITFPDASVQTSAAGETITKNGVTCEIWKDCDGDGKTYGNGDCDESCSTCKVGSTAQLWTADGKDQDCDGTVDEAVADATVVTYSKGTTCNDTCTALTRVCASVGSDSQGTNMYFYDNACDTYAWTCSSNYHTCRNDCNGTTTCKCRCTRTRYD